MWKSALAPYGESFRESLLARGYTWGSAAHLVHLMAHLSRWLQGRGLGASELSAALIEDFLVARRAAGYRHLISAAAMAGLVDHLHARGVLAAPAAAGPASELDRLIGRYEQYLARERGLAAASIRIYLPVARRFLGEVCLDGVVVLDSVGGARVTEFVRDSARAAVSRRRR